MTFSLRPPEVGRRRGQPVHGDLGHRGRPHAAQAWPLPRACPGCSPFTSPSTRNATSCKPDLYVTSFYFYLFYLLKKILEHLFIYLFYLLDCLQSLQKIVPMEAGDPMSQHFSIKEPESCAFPQFRPIYAKRKTSPFTLVHQYDDQKQLLLAGEVWTPTATCPTARVLKHS